jgi:MFS family permease
MSQVLYMIDATLIAVALPTITRRFDDVPRGTVGWAATGFLVAQTSLLLVGGRLGDRHGRKRVFLAGMIAFAVGSTLTAAAPSVWVLIASRALQGAGAAFISSGALALALPMFPASKAAVLIGAWGMVGATAAWATPPLAAIVVERSWRLAFALVVPITVIAIALGRRVLVEQAPARASGPTDRWSYLVGPPALGLTMVVLADGGGWGWLSTKTVALGALAVAGVVALVWRSQVATDPLLDVSLLRVRGYAINLIGGSLQQAGFFAWFLTAPLIMSEMWGWSTREIGWALAASQVLSTIASPLGGQVVLRWGSNAAIALGCVINIGAMAWATVTVSVDSDVWRCYLPMALLFGFGCGMAGTVTTGAALAALPRELLGTGNSLIQLVRRMGSALGTAAGFALLGEATGDDLLVGARRAWLVVAIVHVAVLATLIANRPKVARHVELTAAMEATP